MELNWHAKSMLPDIFPKKLEEAFKHIFTDKKYVTNVEGKMQSRTFSELSKSYYLVILSISGFNSVEHS